MICRLWTKELQLCRISCCAVTVLLTAIQYCTVQLYGCNRGVPGKVCTVGNIRSTHVGKRGLQNFSRKRPV